MSKEALDWVWTQSQSKGVSRLVLLAMADHAEGPSHLVCAGSTWLVTQVNASRSAVLAAMKSLEEKGEIAEVSGVLGDLLHPMWILPKAIGHTETPPGDRDDGRHNTYRNMEERALCSDPDSDLYWMPGDEVDRIVAERIAACVKKHTSSGEPQA
ncbi:hypothetical protein [Streptomyces sp. NPDC051657]|uniref:hypothetical protein n=1 Tax=unclassified Streptomyces TaxID=2593676 RepID=UPI003420325B